MKSLLIFCVGWLLGASLLAAKDFDVMDYGAKGDGTNLDTSFIQQAIDSAAREGGRVVITRGHTFLTGTLQLRSGIDFHLNGNLLISTNRAHYVYDAVITASNVMNLKISGTGRISGRSLEFMTGYDVAHEWWLFQEWRPTMFKLVNCQNLTVRDLTFADAPFWGLHMLGCENVLVDHLTIQNRLDVPNDDGIDPDHCRNVEIRDCDITCGDDAIVVKSTRQNEYYGDCAHIRVHDCKITTQDAGLKIGTETTGVIDDVLFEKCNITSSSRGLCIQLRDEGDVGHVIFRDIKFVSRYHSEPWWGRGEAISFTVHPRTPETKIGKLHDVYVKNVSGRAENSIRISGCAASPIMDVRLENVAVDFSRWTKYPGGVYDNRPTKAIAPIEVHPFDGFNLRYAEHVILDNCAARWNTNTPAAYRSAVQTENGVTVKIFNFHGETEFHPILVK